MDIDEGLISISAVAAPLQAPTHSIFDPGGTLGWIMPMFRMRHPTAMDYILLLLALAAGGAFYYFYYRRALLESVKNMQLPAQVKLRAMGLALFLAAVVLMLAPHWPVGILLVLALIGAAMAAFFGLSVVLLAVLILAIVGIAALKVMHIIP